MYLIKETDTFERTALKFFKKHRDLLPRFKKVVEQLRDEPFNSSLKMHKLKAGLSGFHACSLNYKYRITLIIEIKDKEIMLVDIGSHDKVY